MYSIHMYRCCARQKNRRTVQCVYRISLRLLVLWQALDLKWKFSLLLGQCDCVVKLLVEVLYVIKADILRLQWISSFNIHGVKPSKSLLNWFWRRRFTRKLWLQYPTRKTPTLHLQRRLYFPRFFRFNSSCVSFYWKALCFFFSSCFVSQFHFTKCLLLLWERVLFMHAISI